MRERSWRQEWGKKFLFCFFKCWHKCIGSVSEFQLNVNSFEASPHLALVTVRNTNVPQQMVSRKMEAQLHVEVIPQMLQQFYTAKREDNWRLLDLKSFGIFKNGSFH